MRMERSGLNSDPVFSDQDEHSDNVSVRSSSKLLPPPSWNESSVYSKELPAGATLEHYKILKVLGSGGFGITYLVRDTMLKRKVVLKENFPSSYAYRDPFTGRVIPNNEHDAESFQWPLSNFLNEARVLAQRSGSSHGLSGRAAASCGELLFRGQVKGAAGAHPPDFGLPS